MTTSFTFWLSFLIATGLFRLRPGFLFFTAAFPGVTAHELCHYLCAYVMKGHPEPIDLVPKREGDVWTLGSVAFRATVWNGSFVALAPLLLFPIAYFLALAPHHVESLSTELIKGYLTGCLVNSGLPSRTDWSIAEKYPFGLMVMLLAGLLWWRYF